MKAVFLALKLLMENPEEMESSLRSESPEEVTKGEGGECRDEDGELWEENELEDCRSHRMKIATTTGTSMGASCMSGSLRIFLCIS